MKKGGRGRGGKGGREEEGGKTHTTNSPNNRIKHTNSTNNSRRAPAGDVGGVLDGVANALPPDAVLGVVAQVQHPVPRHRRLKRLCHRGVVEGDVLWCVCVCVCVCVCGIIECGVCVVWLSVWVCGMVGCVVYVV